MATNSSIPGNCSDPTVSNTKIFTPLASYAITAFGVYFLPIIIILGVTGNLFTIVILRQAARKTSSHFYLWCLAIFDIFSLLSYFPTFWAAMLVRPFYFYVYGPINPASWVDYIIMGRYISQLRMFFGFAARTCSIYTIVLVTLERFMLVVFPIKGARFCTMFAAKVSIGVMLVMAVAVSLPWLFSFNCFANPCLPLGFCVANYILFITRLIEFIILTLIPSVLIVVCNGCILYTIRMRQRLTILVSRSDAKEQERLITVRLLSVSFAFVILTIPSLVIISIHTMNEINKDKSHLRGPKADIFVISILLFALNLGINFIIYCLTGKNFRLAAASLLKLDIGEMRKYRNKILHDTKAASETEQFDMLSNERGSVAPEAKFDLTNKDERKTLL